MINKYFLFIFLWTLSFPQISFANTFIKKQIWDNSVQYIDYDISSDIYDIKIAVSDQATDLYDMMMDYNWVTALNWVFFCPKDYSECGWKNFTINERFVEGQEIATYDNTGERVVFGWNEQYESFLYQTWKINADKKGQIYEGFANFPLLLQWGKNQLEHYYDVGLVNKKMRSEVLGRHFICTNEARNHILFGRTSSMGLDEEVWLLLELWCYDALNIDAGNSSAFIYNGRQIVWPGRDVLDGIVIIRKDFDVQKLETTIDSTFQKIRKIFLGKIDTDGAIRKVEKYITQITEIRRSIYDKNSIDFFDDSGKNIGYKIDITSLSTLKKVFLLNSLQKKLESLKKELKNK